MDGEGSCGGITGSDDDGGGDIPFSQVPLSFRLVAFEKIQKMIEDAK